jgi:hypothetical protein
MDGTTSGCGSAGATKGRHRQIQPADKSLQIKTEYGLAAICTKGSAPRA